MVAGRARPQLRPESTPVEEAMLRLRDIMSTDLAAVSPTTTLREAAELLSARHIGGVPVLDGGAVVGVVSASDILTFVTSMPGWPREGTASESVEDRKETAAWDAGDDPAARYFTERWDDSAADVVEQFADEGEGTHEWDALDEHTVGEVMTRDVIALPPTTAVTMAAERMRAADVHRVFVMERGFLRGVVTTTDIARAVADGRVVRRMYVFDTSPVEREHDGGAF
jgi:CBS domain-containing protein